jgi:hypothetical protein
MENYFRYSEEAGSFHLNAWPIHSTQSYSEMSVINYRSTLRRNPVGFCLQQKRYKTSYI